MGSAASGMDREGLERFYDTYFPLVYAFFGRRTGDRQEAEDLTSETFARIARALPRFRPGPDAERSTRVWVYRIAGNVLKNARRSDGRREQRDDHWARQGDGTVDSRNGIELDIALQQAMSQLAPPDREVIRLRFWDELSAKEIGELVGLSQREVYTAIDRAVRQLRRGILEGHGEAVHVESRAES